MCRVADKLRQESEVYDYLSSFLQDFHPRLYSRTNYEMSASWDMAHRAYKRKVGRARRNKVFCLIFNTSDT